MRMSVSVRIATFLASVDDNVFDGDSGSVGNKVGISYFQSSLPTRVSIPLQNIIPRFQNASRLGHQGQSGGCDWLVIQTRFKQFHLTFPHPVGAGSGIGFETAKLLAGQGCKVAIADVNEAALAEKCKEIQAVASDPSNVFATVVDVRVPKQVDDWIAATVSKYGKIDGGVNMAGVIPKCINIERVEDLNDEDWKFVIDVNLHGVMHCMRAQLKNMNVGGSIVNAASICGVIG
jgi:hypothetical protein